MSENYFEGNNKDQAVPINTRGKMDMSPQSVPRPPKKNQQSKSKEKSWK